MRLLWNAVTIENPKARSMESCYCWNAIHRQKQEAGGAEVQPEGRIGGSRSWGWSKMNRFPQIGGRSVTAARRYYRQHWFQLLLSNLPETIISKKNKDAERVSAAARLPVLYVFVYSVMLRHVLNYIQPEAFACDMLTYAAIVILVSRGCDEFGGPNMLAPSQKSLFFDQRPLMRDRSEKRKLQTASDSKRTEVLDTCLRLIWLKSSL